MSGRVLDLRGLVTLGWLLIVTGLGREFHVNTVHWARDVNPRRRKKLVAVKIKDLDVVKNELPHLVGTGEKLDPAGIDDFLAEVPQMYVFDVLVARIESEVPDILVAELLAGADRWTTFVKRSSLTKNIQRMEHINAATVVTMT